MNRETNLPRLFVLLLIAVLAASILCVLYAGTGLAGALTANERNSGISRTAGQYITVRLGQAENNSVAVGKLNGIPALEFSENIDGTVYLTRIYCYEGYLRELFCAADQAMEPDAGEKLMPMEQFIPSAENGLLTIRLTVEGRDERILYALSVKQEEADS